MGDARVGPSLAAAPPDPGAGFVPPPLNGGLLGIVCRVIYKLARVDARLYVAERTKGNWLTAGRQPIRLEASTGATTQPATQPPAEAPCPSHAYSPPPATSATAPRSTAWMTTPASSRATTPRPARSGGSPSPAP